MQRRGEFNQGRRRFRGRACRAQREANVQQTVYVSDINQLVTEEMLANMFSVCGHVSSNLQFSIVESVGTDPHSVLRFAFVEFADEYGARAALSLGGMMLGYYPVRVLPSKTAILPVNPSYLPRVSQTDVKSFFETACGMVTRLRLLGDQVHSTCIAFVEFAVLQKAQLLLIVAVEWFFWELNQSG